MRKQNQSNDPAKPNSKNSSSASPKKGKKPKEKGILETIREVDAREKQKQEKAQEKQQELLAQQKKREEEAYEKRNREERIELMRLKQGVISESESIPQQPDPPKHYSAWQKIKNFFYHSRWWLWIVVVLAGIGGYLVVDLVTREDPDMIVMVLADDSQLQSKSHELQAYFESFTQDANGDGKVKVDIYDIPVTENFVDMDYYTGDATTLTTQFQMADAIVVITDTASSDYILADETLTNLEELLPDDPHVKGTGYYLKDTDFAERIGYEGELGEDICIGLRKPVKTNDSKKKMQKNYDVAWDAIQKVIRDLS